MLAPTAASAQTTTAPGYPGTPTTAAPQPTEADINLGPIETGGVVNVSECNFAPGSTVTLTVSPPGVTISPSVVADSKGCIVVHIEVLPNLVALGRPQHVLAATGLAASGDKVQVRINGQTVTVGPYGTVVDVVSRGTGTNNQARTVTVRFSVAKRGTVTRSGLVRTGTTVAKWTPLGLGLLGIGYLLVLSSKRRRSAAAS
ncbi:MAG: hypothetical protein QOK28_2946 [Actinomycetota bacterium]|jgi:hypothetical protein